MAVASLELIAQSSINLVILKNFEELVRMSKPAALTSSSKFESTLKTRGRPDHHSGGHEPDIAARNYDSYDSNNIILHSDQGQSTASI
jgi:hypothetical protein